MSRKYLKLRSAVILREQNLFVIRNNATRFSNLSNQSSGLYKTDPPQHPNPISGKN